MAHEVHRTAVFALHAPTQHIRAALEAAFRQYTVAYTELLRVCGRFSVDELRGLATFALDEGSGQPRMSARTLSQRLYAREDIARTLKGVCEPLPSRLRQSVKEHVAQTLLSYVALSDAQANDPTRGGAPSAPARLRREQVEQTRQAALADLATLANHERREREIVAQLLLTEQRETVAIPFVGYSPEYGFGLYLNPQTRTFYARLDVVGAASRYARPITAHGRYVDIKSGFTYARAEDAAALSCESFGRSTRALLVPLAMGRWHESRQRLLAAAFLPQRGVDPTQPAAASPVSGKLVRRVVARNGGREREIRYEVHVSFALPAPERAQTDNAARPLLAINRGIHHLYAAVVTPPDASAALMTLSASGAELRATQEALERARAARQRGGVTGTSARVSGRDRRQSRVAAHHINGCANEIVALAREQGAQVVMEDLSAFASGHALRQTRAAPRARQAALRTLLNRRQFERLRQAIDQRLEVVGLPPARLVSAYAISQTCHRCGHRAAENHDPHDPRVFRCERCGATGDIDLVAAANVARRSVWMRLRAEQKRANVPETERTPWEGYAAIHPLRLAGAVAQERGSRV